MRIYTIGFTKKSARTFFGLLQNSGATALIDVRLNNTSQLSGFAKRDDLAYFLETICQMRYVHAPQLAPTQEMLDEYRKGGSGWPWYEDTYLNLLESRAPAQAMSREELDNAVLLCSEDKPHRCHRRLAAEYLQRQWPGTKVEHLL